MKTKTEKQNIFMVTGKGGVGKSAVAAAIAQREANLGRKTLLVELGNQSYFQFIYNRPIPYEGVDISPKLSVALWSGEACLREYVYHLVKVKRIVDLFFDNRVMRTFIKAAPALKELAILGKITSGIRHWGPNLDYESIVVDCFATGHFLALIRAPIGMAELIEAGPMGEQSRKIIEVLKTKNICKYFIVTMPEELPVSEAIELRDSLQGLLDQQAEIVCNRVYESPITVSELNAFVAKGNQAAPAQFAHHLKNKIEYQNEQLKILKAAVGSFIVLPQIFSSRGAEVISTLEGCLP